MEEFQIIDKCLMVKLPEEIDHYRSSYICEKADDFIINQDVDHVVFDFEDEIYGFLGDWHHYGTV